jgi:hypothetical protein
MHPLPKTYFKIYKNSLKNIRVYIQILYIRRQSFSKREYVWNMCNKVNFSVLQISFSRDISLFILHGPQEVSSFAEHYVLT